MIFFWQNESIFHITKALGCTHHIHRNSDLILACLASPRPKVRPRLLHLYCLKNGTKNPYIFTKSQIGCATVPSPVALICWLSGWREPQWPSSPTPSSKRSLVCAMYMQTIYLYCTMCTSLKTSCTSMTPDVCIEMTFNTQNTEHFKSTAPWMELAQSCRWLGGFSGGWNRPRLLPSQQTLGAQCQCWTAGEEWGCRHSWVRECCECCIW